jgi:hypothetical protein
VTQPIVCGEFAIRLAVACACEVIARRVQLDQLRAAAIAALITAAALANTGCSGDRSGPTTPTPPMVPPNPIPSAPQTFVGAGDIGWCGSPAPEQTARLLDGIGGTVFTAGDNAYFSGTAEEFRNCYDPSWGRHKGRTRPVPGNHEYESANAQPYFDYFGPAAGPPGLGYYSYELGDWHVVALNSNIPVDVGSAQAAWLRGDLGSSSRKCTLAYWHHPLFTSGPNGAQAYIRSVWRILYDFNVDVVVNGHDHLYERFAPQDADGRMDPTRGIREFIVGTGGAGLYEFVGASPNSERQIQNTFGVLKFTLQNGTYQWNFVPVSGPSDSGTASCH